PRRIFKSTHSSATAVAAPPRYRIREDDRPEGATPTGSRTASSVPADINGRPGGRGVHLPASRAAHGIPWPARTGPRRAGHGLAAGAYPDTRLGPGVAARS